MADTTTLSPTTQISQRPPERVNRNTPGLMNDGREQDLETEQSLGARTFIPEVFENAWNPVVSGLNDVRIEATSAMADLFNIARGAETPLVNNPASGSIENFNQPRTQEMNPQEAVADAHRIINEHAQKTQAHYESVNASIEQVTQIHAIEEQARLEAQGMEDGEYAEKAGYKNTGFRGFLSRGLKTIANNFAVRARRVAELFKLVKEKEASGPEVLNKRTSAKGAASGTNELLFNAVAEEGQSAIKGPTRVG